MDNEFGGSWSIRKLEKLENYIESYLQAMSNQGKYWSFVYIDAFAGNGYQKIKHKHPTDQMVFSEKDKSKLADEFIAGSALRAIQASSERAARNHASFQEYVFIDKKGEAISDLRRNIADKHPGELSKCQFKSGDANQLIGEVIKSYDWKKTRGVAFIDPFNMSITASMLRSLAETGALDVWMLFPLSAVCRVMAKNGVPDSWKPKLDALYGSSDWMGLYETRELATLFDTVDTRIYRQEGIDQILQYTTGWLKGIFADASETPYILKTDMNQPLFALYSAISSSNVKAIALWKRLSNGVLADKK